MPNITLPPMLDETMQGVASKTELVAGKLVTPKSDWDESDSTKISYIQNKPELYNLASASGNPVTITSGSTQSLRNFVMTWMPTQEGSGDPSPTNVRNFIKSNKRTITVKDSNNVVQSTTDLSFGLFGEVCSAVINLGTKSLSIPKTILLNDVP